MGVIWEHFFRLSVSVFIFCPPPHLQFIRFTQDLFLIHYQKEETCWWLGRVTVRSYACMWSICFPQFQKQVSCCTYLYSDTYYYHLIHLPTSVPAKALKQRCLEHLKTKSKYIVRRGKDFYQMFSNALRYWEHCKILGSGVIFCIRYKKTSSLAHECYVHYSTWLFPSVLFALSHIVGYYLAQ